MLLRGVNRAHLVSSYGAGLGSSRSSFRLKVNHARGTTNARFFSLKAGKTAQQLPSAFTAYINTNNQEVPLGIVGTVRVWLGLPPSKPSPSSYHSDSEDDHLEEEGDFDIRLGEADSLQSIEDDIKRTQLFSAMEDLCQSVRLNHVTPFKIKFDLEALKSTPEMREFLLAFENLFDKRRLLTAISAAEIASRKHPTHIHQTLQCRAAALVELARGAKDGSAAEQKLFALKRDELLRTAVDDMEAALAAEPSAEIANQLLNLSTLAASFSDYYSLLLAKQVVSFLIAKTAKEMKDTHMRLVNLYALFSSHLAHFYAAGGYHKFRHASVDTYIRFIVLDVIKALTSSIQDHVHFPPRQIQEMNVLGMLDFRSKLWMAIDEKERALADLNLALDCGPTDERLLRRANVYHDLKNYAKAIEDVTKVAEKGLLEFDLNWLASLYELNGQTDKMLLLWRFILLYSLPTESGLDGNVYAKLAGIANHAKLYGLADFAATDGLSIATSRADVSYDLICDLYGRRGAATYNSGDMTRAMADIRDGLEWYNKAVRNNACTDAVKKAAAELYLLRGSIHIYSGNMRKAFADFDMCVKLVPSMIQRVKEFQDSITITKSTRYIYIDKQQIMYAVVACVGVYIGVVLLS